MSSFALEHTAPTWLIIVAACAVTVFWLRTYWNEVRGSSGNANLLFGLLIRLIVCAGVIWLWLQPTNIEEQKNRQTLKTVLAFDVSASMSQRDETGLNLRTWQAPYDAAQDTTTTAAVARRAVDDLAIAKLVSYLASDSTDPDETKRLMASAAAHLRTASQNLSEREFAMASSDRIRNAAMELAQQVDDWRENAESGSSLEPSFVSEMAEQVADLYRLAIAFQEHLRQRETVTEPSSSLRDENERPRESDRSRTQLMSDWLADSRTTNGLNADGNTLTLATFAGEDSWSLKRGPIASTPQLRSESERGDQQTDLQFALNEIGRMANEDRADVAVVVTDGMHTKPDRKFQLPGPLLSRPVILVPIGDPNVTGNMTIRSVSAPGVAREGDVMPINVVLESKGAIPKQAVVELMRDGEVLQSQDVDFTPGNARRSVDFRQSLSEKRSGKFDIRIRPRDAADWEEASVDHPFRVTGDKLNVLLSDSTPRWETRYLDSLFRRDPEVDVELVLFSSANQGFPGRDQAPPVALPVSPTALQRFDMMILGDLDPIQLSRQHQLAIEEYVRTGGNLIVIAGKESMPASFVDQPFADLLPVERAGGFFPVSASVRPENKGRALTQLVDNDSASRAWTKAYELVPLRQMSSWLQPKAAAETLLRSTSTSKGEFPLLTIHRFGSGSVAFLGSPVSWHLRVGVGDRLHHRLWGQLLRAISDGSWAQQRLITIRPETDRLDSPGLLRCQVALRDQKGRPLADANLEVVAYQNDVAVSSGQCTALDGVPGSYASQLNLPESGDYELRVEGDAVYELLADVSESQAVRQQVDCRVQVGIRGVPSEDDPLIEPPAFFREISENPYAITISPGRVPELVRELRPRTETTMLKKRSALWNRWWILLGLCGLLTCEWTLRRVSGVG